MGESAFLREWKKRTAKMPNLTDTRRIPVEPLTEAQCREFLAQRFESVESAGREISAELFENTRGNPYFLEQLIEGYDAESGAFVPIPLDQIIKQRLSKCPDDAFDLLNVISVAGKAVTLEEVSAVAGRSSVAIATITHMRSERLVRMIGSQDESLVDTYHDKIREAALDGLGALEQKELHRRYAETIESETHSTTDGLTVANARIFDLAYHFAAAGDSRAGHYELESGLAALRSYALEESLEYLRRAAPHTPAGEQFRLRRGLGETLLGLARFGESREHLEAAIELAPSPVEQAECSINLASAFEREGKLLESVGQLDRALIFLSQLVPRTTLGEIIGICRSLILIHAVPDLRRSRSLSEAESRKEQLTSLAYSRYIYSAVGSGIISWVHAFLRNPAVAKFAVNPNAKALAFAAYSFFLAGNGFQRLARRRFRMVQLLMPQVDNDLVRTYIHQYAGAMYFFLGDFANAKIQSMASIPELVRTRDYLLGESYHWLRHTESACGNVTEILKWANLELESAAERNDLVVMGYGHYGLADGFARIGDFAKGISHAKEACRIFADPKIFTLGIAMQELARAQLQASQYAVAQKSWQDCSAYLFRNLFLNELVLDTFSIATEARLGPYWHQGPKKPQGSERRTGLRAARKARMFCFRFPTLRPHCFRVSGRAFAAAGKKRKAVGYFDKAIAAGEKIGAEYERARALIDKSMLDYPNALTDRQTGLNLLESLGCVLPDAEVVYLGIDRQAHHQKSAAAREKYCEENNLPEFDLEAWEGINGPVTPQTENSE